MKILIFNGCWTPNIGNAFVNLGIEEIVKKAFPGSEILYSADVNNSWYFAMATSEGEYTDNAFNISKYIDLDLVVWGGMMLTKECLDSAGDIFLSFAERNIPVIFLGAGADKYDQAEQEFVASYLSKIELFGIIARDDPTYDSYCGYDFMKHKLYKGIDAAFFVSDVSLPLLNLPKYDVECFDRIEAPDINHEGRFVIKTHHDCFGKLPETYINAPDTLISELPYDYLAVYKYVNTTYAERVHACIATLAFGNSAQLYSDTPRAALFDKVLSEDWKSLTTHPVKADMDKLQKAKDKMVKDFKRLYFTLTAASTQVDFSTLVPLTSFCSSEELLDGLAEELSCLFSKCGVTPPSHILEFGCYDGRLSAILAKKGYKVSILNQDDLKKRQFEELFHKMDVDINIINFDAFNSTEPEFDLVWNSFILGQLNESDLKGLFSMISRATKDRFLFLVPNPDSIAYLLFRYQLQGVGRWPAVQEHLNRDYLKLAKSYGLSGHMLGYAALTISRNQMESVFSGHINADMYSDMAVNHIIPENEGFLSAYLLYRDEGNSGVELLPDSKQEDYKEQIFNICSEKFNLLKQLDECRSQIISLNYRNNECDIELKACKDTIEDYKAAKFQTTEQIQKLNEHLERVTAKSEEQNTHICQLTSQLEIQEQLNSQQWDEIQNNKTEIARLVEGNEFNESEARKWFGHSKKIEEIYVPQIIYSSNKIKEYVNARSLSRLLRIHAVIGHFKNTSLTGKVKLLVKLLLRCVGVRKRLYYDQESSYYEIESCLADIQNTIALINKYSEQDYHITEQETNSVSSDIFGPEEVIISQNPKISVLLPVYNHASFICSAIEGVQGQYYDNWELIIINDGSTDNLLEILEEYKNDPRIRVYSQENQRLPNTLTNLHQLADGQFITWTSADNIMEPDMLKELSMALMKHPQAAMVYADVCIIDDKGNYLSHDYREMNRDRELPYIMRLPHSTEALDAECDNFINACFMYRRDAASAMGGVYSADLEGLEDYDFWLRIRAFGEILHIKNQTPLYRYRVHANTMSEDLLKNKLEEHVRRSNQLMEYSHARDRFISENWNIVISENTFGAERFLKSLSDIHYSCQQAADKTAYYLSEEEMASARNHNLYIVPENNFYSIFYKNNNVVEKRCEIYKGCDIPVLSQKARQTFITGLFWEYPADFVNKRVIGCHLDLNLIDIQRTITLLQNNQDFLFSFCPVIGGKCIDAEKEITINCKNAVFLPEKELGTPVYLYASWDMQFVPPLKNKESDLMPSLILTWNIGKWLMLESLDRLPQAFPLVCSYDINERLIGLKQAENLDSIEELLNQYIDKYSRKGAVTEILKYLNGIGQDLFVERPDFNLKPKQRKCPEIALYQEYTAPQALRNGYIAMLTDTLDKGGLEQVVAMLAREWIKYGLNVKIFCTMTGGTIARQLSAQGIDVIEFHGKREAFSEYLNKHRPLLVNSHYAKNMVDIVSKNKIPLVEVIHNMYVFQNDDLWSKERELEKYFDRMIAVSQLVKEVYIKKHGKVNPDKIKVIGNAADNTKIHGASRQFIRSSLGISNDSYVFINASSIDGRKNQLGLISAFHEFYQTVNKDSYLIMVGNILSEFYDNALNEYIKELDCSSHIIKLEYHKDITGLYHAADVFVMPSYFEGWSIAATEALYCGLPLIHSCCGSAIELIENGRNGIMISNPAGDIIHNGNANLNSKLGNRLPENTSELVQAMKKLYENREYWTSQKTKIAENALFKYSQRTMVENYLTFFCELLRGTNS